MMMGPTFVLVMMMALMNGGSDAEIVALVQPAHYFKTRQIEISIDKAVEYASESPKDGKKQIMQLTAIRYLTDEAEALKKSPKYAAHRQVLEQIAEGKKANDPHGFAQDHARRLILKLDNARPAAVKLKAVREDALSWFPADVNLTGAFDVQQVRQFGADTGLRELLKLIPDREKEKMYEFIEKVGNVRIDRASFAYKEGAGGMGDGQIFVRISGKGNHDAIVELIKMLDGPGGRLQFKTAKDEKGTPITTMREPNNPPVVMLIGNTDLLIVGHERMGKDDELADAVMAIRAGKKPNTNTGKLKDRLAKVPDKALGFLVGDVPEAMKRDLRFVLDPVPNNILAYVERAQQGLDVQVHTSMANRDDGDKLVQKIGGLRKEGIMALQQQMKQPLPPGSPPIPFQALVNLLESLQVQSDKERVSVRVVVPDGLMQQLTSGWFFLGMRGRVAPCE